MNKILETLLEEKKIKLKGSLYHLTQINFSYNSNHIEGNRLIMFKECLRNDIVPFIIDEEHKLFYYRGLKNYKEDKTYLIETCLSAQDKYIKLLNDLEIFK